ncbi:PAS domain S-box protein [Natribaculum luteum]|uniref:PAS domain S-box protein n=1 Tax=Natribaculum luteum TaxID=1586232 RepID=A0ABD5NXQ4_9EURY|nr:PAS domain S-box protein [Natribaculum luteum]
MSGGNLDALSETLAVFDRMASPRTPLTTSEVAAELEITRRAAYERLDRLVERDAVETKKVGARGRVWWLSARDGSVEADDDHDRSTDEHEQMLSRLVDNVPGIVYRCRYGEGWPMSFVSDGCAEITGYDPATLESGDVSWERDVVHPDDADYVREEVQAQLDEDGQFSLQFRIQTADGNTRWVQERGYGVGDDDDEYEILEGVITDITDQKRAEQALSERERQFRSMIDATEEYAIFMLDADGRVSTWNRGAEQIKGYEREEIVGEHVSTFYTDEAADEGVPERNLADAAADGSTEDEGWRVRKDGSRFWAYVTLTAIHDEDGDLAGYAKVTRDMTDRREYEQRLRQQRDDLERELDEIFKRIDDAFYAVDDEYRFTYVNDRAEELLQHSREELLGESIWETFPQAAETDAWERFHRALSTQEPTSFETHYEPLGFWVEGNIYPSESGLSVYFRDITERKEREQKLEQYRKIVETIDDGVYALDDDERFVMANDAFLELVGYDREELLGKPAKVVHSEQINATATEMSDQIVAGDREAGILELDLVRKDGETVPVETRFAPFPVGDGYGRCGVVRDVSTRLERERALEESERRYRTLAENFPNGGVVLLDEELRHTLVEGKGFERLDIDAADLRGERVQDVYPDDVREIVEPNYRAALEGETTSFELEFQGRSFKFWVLPLTDDDGDVFAAMAMSQDVTDRRQFEETLQALHDSTRQMIRSTTKAEVGETVVDAASNVLDLPGVIVYRHDDDRDLLVPGARSVEADFMRQAFPEVPPGDESITGHVFATGESRNYDDIFESPRLQAHDTEMRSGLFVPIGDHGIIVVGSDEIGSLDDRTRHLVEVLAANAETAYDRVEREQNLERQRGQLAALNELNELVREITDAIIEQSTREEIEEIVCQRLAEMESYAFAWIGAVDSQTQTVDLRTEAGIEGYLEGITISVDPDDERSQGPTGRAVLQREIQTTQDIREDTRHDPWREQISDYGFRSSAAIPIVHEGTLYGVLNVYAERPYAFTDDERTVISQLGEIVGHAIAAVERKRALTSDQVVELEFQIRDFFEAFDVSASTDERITFDQTVPVADGEYLVYGTATDDGMSAVEALVEQLPQWDGVSVIDERFGEIQFELRLSEPTILSTVASHGGSVSQSAIEDGDYRMTVHLPQGANVRQVIETIEEAYPAIEPLARRQVARSSDIPRLVKQAWMDELTDRQRTALETAYFAGFFEWPRNSSGEDVADSLDITSATFHQHVRAAERKLFDALFEELSLTGPE